MHQRFEKRVWMAFSLAKSSLTLLDSLTGVLANERLAKCRQMSTLFFSFADAVQYREQIK